MQTRHLVDVSITFDANATQPPQRRIEVAGLDPVAPTNPPTEPVSAEPYVAGPEVQEIVNLAIALGRPLLLQGDPGVGKTRLAYAVAYALGLPLERAHIKSTSRGQDLLYTFDAVRRLYDAQLRQRRRHDRDPRDYVALGPMGRAIARAVFGRRSVLLIDEIDKADLDFPNDLLQEIDRLGFDVPEVPGLAFQIPTDRPDLRPIIFVTNNEEKSLPSAFLRRCLFHHLRFPQQAQELERILEMHGIGKPRLRTQAAETLIRLRELDLMKKPGLSELLDWVGYLDATGSTPEALHDLPHLGALIKSRGDHQRVAGWLRSR